MNPKANALGLVVADLTIAIAFYGHLGLEFGPTENGHAACDLGEGFRLMLDTEESIQSFTSAWSRPTGSPRAALAFQFETPAEVDHKFAELMSAGYKGERGPWDAGGAAPGGGEGLDGLL